MSFNNASGAGSVSNLRAIFENKKSDDRSASPPSRGRSPALSDASIRSRPVSKVRASFVAVERPGDSGEGQIWGLRKASDVANMAETKQELANDSLANRATDPPDSHAQLNGEHSEPEPPSQANTTDENTQGGLGSILKGSAFEGSPPISRVNGIGTEEPSTSPTSQKKNLAASKMNESTDSKPQNKSIGSRIKDAVASNHNQPPRAAKLKTTKDAKPIKPPPTRQVPPAKISTKSPTSPRAPRTPVSPNLEKPMTHGSAAKPTAVVASAKNAVSPERAKKSPTLPRETRNTSLNTQAATATRPALAPPRTNGTRKQTSPEVKPRPSHVPASTAAPTAVSAAKTTNSTTLGPKPTVTKRDRPLKPSTTTAPATKKIARTSLPNQADGTDKTKPRTSTARKVPDGGFLARMMRPTASSAQKAHEKVAPSSPPQTKRAAPVHAAKGKARGSLPGSDEDKGKARGSLPGSDEDKENTHRGGPESEGPPPTSETREDDVDGDDKADPSPLKDITPAVEPEGSTAESKPEAVEMSTA